MKEKIKDYIFIIVISIIIAIPLFSKNFNIYIDDGIQHICRIMGTYQSITENQIFPVVFANFCNGFGYSWNLFYSPITAYIPLLFHFITDSFILDVKIFMILISILSGITMYEFLYNVTKNKYIGLLGAIIYIVSPYRLTDMYIRMALAEMTSFMFLPMIFHGLYNIFNEECNSKKSEILLILGAVGLILSHSVIAMYTAIIATIYVLINVKKLKNKTVLKKIIVSLILILCITSFFWLSMLEQKVNTEYEVFKEGRMERTDVLLFYKLNLLDLIYTQKGNMSFEIGLFTLIGLIFTPFVLKKIDKRYRKIYTFSLIMGIISIIMTLQCFPFEKLPNVLKMLQFSFRMLEFSSFFLSIVVAINYINIIDKFKTKDMLVLTFIIILLTIPLSRLVPYKNDIDESKLWPAIKVTENTGRVHAGCASFEYLPSKAFEKLNYIKTRENKVYIMQGQARIENEQKNGSKLTFNVVDAEENTKLELPYIYYSGYTAILENSNIKKELKTYESENGFVEICIEDGGDGNIILSYTGTTTMKISMVISIISFTVMILYYIKNKEDKSIKK